MNKLDPEEWAREFAEHADVWGVGALTIMAIPPEPDGPDQTKILYLFDPRDEFNMIKLIARYVRCGYEVTVSPAAENGPATVKVSVHSSKFELIEEETAAAFE
ncbi:hypothetical protein GTY75_05180 [Streptomyces sp. SID8381]|uniref:hypothetical protein n=1 Tax=unclassified Streptomyces TaxID=2593676 RepID=UPI0003826E69|nr:MULTISPECIES: hypothetical protein [unclassified Streptomyces]MYX26066.1 hypothetical protein [Streptomyces sp. SID8381]